MFSSLLHLILIPSISYPYFIKFHDFAEKSKDGIRHQMRGATQAQHSMTVRITLVSSSSLVPIAQPYMCTWLPLRGYLHHCFSLSSLVPIHLFLKAGSTYIITDVWSLPKFQQTVHPLSTYTWWYNKFLEFTHSSPVEESERKKEAVLVFVERSFVFCNRKNTSPQSSRRVVLHDRKDLRKDSLSFTVLYLKLCLKESVYNSFLVS
jgi:hypothetical protein